jgi:hypothetical protein
MTSVKYSACDPYRDRTALVLPRAHHSMGLFRLDSLLPLIVGSLTGTPTVRRIRWKRNRRVSENRRDNLYGNLHTKLILLCTSLKS